MKKFVFIVLVAVMAIIICLTLFSCTRKQTISVEFVVNLYTYETVNNAVIGQRIRMPDDYPNLIDKQFEGWYWDLDVWEKPFDENSLINYQLPEGTKSIKVYAKYVDVNKDASSLEQLFLKNGGMLNEHYKFLKKGDAYFSYIDNSDASMFTHIEDPVGIKSIVFVDGNTPVAVQLSGESSYGSVIKKLDNIYSKRTNTHYQYDPDTKIIYAIERQSAYFALIYGIEYDNETNCFYSCNKQALIRGSIWTKSVFEVPKHVSIVGYSAFLDCEQITSVIIPNNVKTIEDCAFKGCLNLETLNLTVGLENIGKRTLDGCTNLTKVTYDGNNSEWNTITKGENWISGIEPTIKPVCKNEHILVETYTCSDRTCTYCGETIKATTNHSLDGIFECQDRTCILCKTIVVGTKPHTPEGEFACIDRPCKECKSIVVATEEHVFKDAYTCHDRECINCKHTVAATTEHKYEGPACMEKLCTECKDASSKIAPTSSHWGGKATCSVKAKCEACNTEYGETLPHTFLPADCETPSTCSVCSFTVGEPLGHLGGTATCTQKPICIICNKEYGNVLEHDYQAATCLTPETCALCGATRGEKLPHSGGQATCLDKAICEMCNQPYGELSTEHNWVGASCIEERSCSVCNYTDNQPLGHIGGTATCKDKAICQRCEQPYGELVGHNWLDATCEAPKTCDTCGITEGEKLQHRGGDATCIALAECELCGTPYGEYASHEYESNSCCCRVCGEFKQHIYNDIFTCHDRVCTVCGLVGVATTEHQGGSANCTKRAICSLCHEPYGEPLGHVYAENSCICIVCNVEKPHVYADEYTCHDRACAICGKEVIKATTLHTGGRATCTTKAACENCLTEYGDYAEHRYEANSCICGICNTAKEHVFPENSYSCQQRACIVCNVTVAPTIAHTGGIATCTQRAVCTICNDEYGTVYPHVYDENSCVCLSCQATAHIYPDEYTCHDRACTVCHFLLTASTEHTGTGATCTEAAYCADCQELYMEALGHTYAPDSCICIICAYTKPHIYLDEYTCHDRACTICSIVLDASTEHSGGVASCMVLATCDVCNEQYGEFDAHTYPQNSCICSVCNEQKQHTYADSFNCHDRACTVCSGGIIEKTEPHDFGTLLYTLGINFGSQRAVETTNDSQNPFSIIQNTLTSTNKEISSTSSYVITALSTVAISFEYSVSSEFYFDVFTIKLNSATIVQESGFVDFVSLGLELNVGDSLVFSYNKDTSISEGDDCVYIRNLVVADKNNVTCQARTCKRCGEICEATTEHVYSQNSCKCDNCGENKPHTPSDNFSCHDRRCTACNIILKATTEHIGGIATCSTLAVCEICGEEYGALANHEYELNSCCCSVCKSVIPDTTNHVGGTATCINRAICSQCNNEYGEFADHSYEQFSCTCSVCGHTKEHVYADQFTCHNRACTNCKGAVIVAVTEHVGGNATCDKKAVCEICGDSYGNFSVHIYGPNSCTCLLCNQINEHTYRDTFTCQDRTCVYCGNISVASTAHVGGTATNVQRAICANCQKPYGEMIATENLLYIQSIDQTSYSVGGVGSSLETIIVIPSTYNGLPVTSIDKNAFNGNTSITSLTIPDSIISINGGAFQGCTGLLSVQFYDNSQLFYIGENAFSGCTELSNVTLQNNLTTIDNFAFSNCESFTAIEIPASVTSIGMGILQGCDNLTSISVQPDNIMYRSQNNCLISNVGNVLIASGKNSTIPDSVSSIGKYSFAGQLSLTTLRIPNNVAMIDDYAFFGCSNLSTIVFVGTTEEWDNIIKSVNWNCDNVPTNIDPCAISHTYEPNSCLCIVCGQTKQHILSDDIACHVRYCTNCNESIAPTTDHQGGTPSCTQRAICELCAEQYGETLPHEGGTATCIEKKICEVCSQAYGDFAEHIYPENSCTCDVCHQIKEHICADYYTCHNRICTVCNCLVPASTDHSGGTATYTQRAICDFCGEYYGELRPTEGLQYEINDDNLSYTVTGIDAVGDSTIIVIPSKYNSLPVTAIKNNAFANCNRVNSVTIPNSVTSIGEYAFDCCYGITSITIPNSVTSIGNLAFRGCSGLTAIAVEQGNSVYHSQSNCIIETANNTIVLGCKTSGIPNYVMAIGGSAFNGCSDLTEVIIPASVTSISFSAFKDCYSIASITVEEGNSVYHSDNNCLIESATNSLVLGCKNSILPDYLEKIGREAFFGCKDLTEIAIPDRVISIGVSVFRGCSSLIKIVIPNGITVISAQALYGCSNLTSVTLSENVVSIGDNAFDRCDNLTSIVLPNSVTSIGEKAFQGCNKLSKIIFAGTSEQWNSVITAQDYKLEDTTIICNPCAIRHTYTDEYTCHNRTCTMCDNTIAATTEHQGGNANCFSPAICQNCMESYGELTDHSYDEDSCTCSVCGHVKPHVYADELTCHDRACTICGQVLSASLPHTYEAGQCRCSVCGETKEHTYTVTYSCCDRTCIICNETSYATTNHTVNANCVCTVCGNKDHSLAVANGYCRHGNNLYFGSYPQQLVTNPNVIDTLNGFAGTLPTEHDNQGWSGYNYYENGVLDNNMWYIDIVSEGNKYRGVYFNSYRPYFTAYTSIAEHSFQDDNGYSDLCVYWFKYMPIKWDIISEGINSVTVIANTILDSQAFDFDGSCNNNYSESTIRNWLNDNFYQTAFDGVYQSFIEYVTVDNSMATTQTPEENIFVCENTQDKIWLLSYQDVYSKYFTANSQRTRQGSDYAKIQGLWQSTDEGLEGNSCWWLRSPYYESYISNLVNYNGEATCYPAYSTQAGVMPALKFNFCGLGHSPDSNCVCTICGVKDHSTACANGFCKHDNDIYFGSYPQSEVTQAGTIATLNTLAGTLPTESNSQNWTSYGYYANSDVANFMWYIDVEVGNAKYRGVYFTSYRPFDTTCFGTIENSLQDDYSYAVGNAYWFKYEPIKWNILAQNGRNAILLADLILDAQAYQNSYIVNGNNKYNDNPSTPEGIYANNYEYSTIRNWLTTTFYESAFNELQQQLIQTTEVGNGATTTENKNNNPYAGNNTSDKLWLLSYEDTSSFGFAPDTLVFDQARKKYASNYAMIQGVEINTVSNYGWWWLRSPYNSPITGVSSSNGVSTFGYVHLQYLINKACGGIVPALTLDLCGISHTYQNSCTCTVCGLTTHVGGTATCITKATCENCQTQYGELAPHNWQEATCQTPKTCSVCQITEGSPREHVFVNGICSFCNFSFTRTVLLIEDNLPWNRSSNTDVLDILKTNGKIADYTKISSSTLMSSSINLSDYNVILLANDQQSSFYNNVSTKMQEIIAFVSNGGSLIMNYEGASGFKTGAFSSMPFNISYIMRSDYNNVIYDANHPIIKGSYSDNDALTNSDMVGRSISHGYFTNLPENSHIIVKDTAQNTTMFEFDYGNGRVIVSALTWEWAYYSRETNPFYASYDDLILHAVWGSPVR